MAQAAAAVDSVLPVSMDAAGVVASYPGPACLFDSARRPIVANAFWQSLGLPMPSSRRVELPGRLAVDLLSAANSGQVRTSARRFPAPKGSELPVDVVVEFSIVPAEMEGERVLIALGSDQTMSETLQYALGESREFHRTFAACTTDFIWQVDATGVIDYVGSRGLLDHSADELFGTPVSQLYSDVEQGEASLVFLSREPVWESEVWLSDKSGGSHCFLVSSVPVRDSLGRWLGARGVGREITEQRVREAELQKARHSQRMIDSVLHAMRSEVDPRAILDAATIVASDSARLDACLVAGLKDGCEPHWVARTIPEPALNQRFERVRGQVLDAVKSAMEGETPRVVRFETAAGYFLISATSIEGEVNGAVVFGRHKDGVGGRGGAVWSVEDEHILRAMTDQMGVCLAQFDMVESLRGGRSAADG